VEKIDYQTINAQTIDRWVEAGWEWGRPISHDVYEKAKGGQWDVYLTPTKPVPHEWLGALRSRKDLGLASGGGPQMPLFCAPASRRSACFPLLPAGSGALPVQSPE